MVVDACVLRNDEVSTSDNKKLGAVVNVIFKGDSKSPTAWILVFPFEGNWLKEHVTNNWGGVTIDLVKSMMPEEISKFESEMVNKGTDTADKYWAKYVEANAGKLEMKMKMCYFIPIRQIDEAKRTDGKIVLKLNYSLVGDKYRFIGEPPVTNAMMPMFASINQPVRNLKSLMQITLNLSPICQEFEVHDSTDEAGYIDDLQLDFEQGTVTGIIVRKDGADAGRYFVPPADFDFSEMRLTKPLTDCSKLED